jgi:16S rRNA (guanine(966)-N(2))-methyltransferase RsmD
VRITGGLFRGRNIHAPKNLPVRPTTDFAKSALFNILNNHFDLTECDVLDLFAGAGSITYEFLSREVRSVTSVDRDFHCVGFIKKTADELKCTNVHCLRADAFKFASHSDKQWDIVFADPPFAETETDRLPDLIFSAGLLKPGGWLIVEHQAKRVLKSKINPFETRKYGNCAFSIYRKEKGDHL